jgi:hypothetical protein
MSWTLKEAMLKQQMKKDEKQIGEAASKKSTWGKVGSTLGTIAALTLAPATIGAVGLGTIAGLGSGIGGFIGAEGLTKAKHRNILSGKHKGAVFFKDDAKELKRELGEEIIADALKTGVTTTFTAGTDSDFLSTLKGKKPAVDSDFLTNMKKFISNIELPEQSRELKTYGD